MQHDGCFPKENLDEIMEQYATMVYRLAYAQTRSKHDADDIFQEVFFRYIKKCPVFASKEHQKAWFLRVTLNCSKKFHASAWRRNTVPLDQQEFVFEQLKENELHELLLTLPQKYRAVLHLFYYEDMPVAQISQILNKKPSTIRMQLTRARALLKEKLKGEES